MRISRNHRALLIALFCGGLSACGAGSSDSNAGTPPPAQIEMRCAPQLPAPAASVASAQPQNLASCAAPARTRA